jgi:hypothetical protein
MKTAKSTISRKGNNRTSPQNANEAVMIVLVEAGVITVVVVVEAEVAVNPNL